MPAEWESNPFLKLLSSIEDDQQAFIYLIDFLEKTELELYGVKVTPTAILKMKHSLALHGLKADELQK